ncbi:hypothetical protein M0R04_01075 [Candidatus Dojkabacteria bacterium]|jgi:hypothetical protein|nr:hypothetical protein [Candidatus Dojkabacteria bacterium]
MENITLKQISDLLDVRFEAFEKKIDSKLESFRLELVSQVNEMMNSKLESFGRMMDLRFDKIDSRLDKIESRLDKMDLRFDKMDKELLKINNKLERHTDKILDIQGVLMSPIH